MKKFIAMLLALTMVLAFAACAKPSSPLRPLPLPKPPPQLRPPWLWRPKPLRLRPLS